VIGEGAASRLAVVQDAAMASFATPASASTAGSGH
jgi:hypothetical protein